MNEYILGFAIAILIGMVSSVIGVGGGTLNVPALTLLLGVDPKVAIGTSLTIIIFTSLSGFVSYARQRRIFYRSALFIILPSILFSAIGSYATVFVSGPILTALFSVLLLFIALQMLIPALPFVIAIPRGPYFDEECNDCFCIRATCRSYYIHLFFWGAIAGFVGGITGLGGGVINVPALVSIGMPIHFAVATSILIILVTSVSGSIVHQRLGHVALDHAISFSLGAIIGAQVGAALAPKIRSELLKKCFAVFLLIMALYLLVRIVL